MTLIITAITQDTIYQSADFRLSNLDTGLPLTDESTKLITLTYKNWRGFIGYTGIGRWNRNDTTDIVTDWLASVDPDSPDDLINVIVERGTRWLEEIEQAIGRQRHTFVLAAIDEGGPRVTTISNFEDLRGWRSPQGTNRLFASTVRAKARPALVLAGATSAVDKNARRRLSRALGQNNPNDARIRRVFTEINVAASKKNSTISANCSFIYFTDDGGGALNMDGGIEFRAVAYGNVMPKISEILPEGLDGGKLAWATFGSIGTPRRRRKCDPITINASEGSYDFAEIKIQGICSSRAESISGDGIILGVGYLDEDANTSRAWRSTPEGRLDFVEHPSDGGAVNRHGQAAITVHVAPGRAQAGRWGLGPSEPLRSAAGTTSSAFVINSVGNIGGSVTSPAGGKPVMPRPAVWLPGHEGKVLEDGEFDQGKVVALRENNQALAVCYNGGTPITVLWNYGTDEHLVYGTGLTPVDANNAGQLLAYATDETDLDTPYLLNAGDTQWTPIVGEGGFRPTAMNDVGDIVGADSTGRPWLRRASGEVVMLSYYQDHWCWPRDINSKGEIVGFAGSDHGMHAVIWLPVTAAPIAA